MFSNKIRWLKTMQAICVSVWPASTDGMCLLQKVTTYNTVTQLASLTDHLPVAITFTIDLTTET